MKRVWRVKVPDEKVMSIAAKLVEQHDELLSDGYRLMGSSGVWRTKSDGLTARFVYRLRAADRATTMTFTIRGIRP